VDATLSVRGATRRRAVEDGAGDWTWFERLAVAVLGLDPDLLEVILAA